MDYKEFDERKILSQKLLPILFNFYKTNGCRFIIENDKESKCRLCLVYSCYDIKTFVKIYEISDYTIIENFEDIPEEEYENLADITSNDILLNCDLPKN